MNKKIRYAIALATLLITVSCGKFLDLQPISAPTDNNFWQTQDDANSAVAATYVLLRQAFNHSSGISFYAYGDFASDELTTTNGAPWMFDHMINMNWSFSVPASDTGNPLLRLRRYDIFYRVIDQSNRVIKFVSAMPTDRFSSLQAKNNLLGEAYFMRAFTYFYMSRIWGGVPLVTETVPVTEATDLPVSTADQVLSQVMSDIETARTLTVWSTASATTRAIRASKATVFALKAHVHAWKGEYVQCAEAADSVLSRGRTEFGPRTAAGYKSMFAGNSNEAIFEISQNTENEGTVLGIANYTLAGPHLRNRTNPVLNMPKDHLRKLFNKDDRRYNAVFDTVSSPLSFICTKYGNVSYTSDEENAVAVFKNNITVFRHSDIKLLYAEALAATNQPSQATAILNEVRALAGFLEWQPSTGEAHELFNEIMEERARELFMEGHRYYDMIRQTRYTGDVSRFGTKMTIGQFQAGKYYWPFDPSLLNTNRRLVQTNFWSTVNM